MAKANIRNGVWTRRVPWHQNGKWRTDIFKSVLGDPCLKECRFILGNGPTLIISATELRKAVVGGADHYDQEIWGPFNLDPSAQTVANCKVAMKVE
jgi:hypothetical protein